MTLGARIVDLFRLTLRDPAQAARTLLAQDVPFSARTAGLLLVAVLSALLASLQLGEARDRLDPLSAFMLASPIRAAVVQWLLLALTVLLVHRVGRAFGGRGTLPDALLVVVWLQLPMLAFQVVQMLIAPVAPQLAGLVGLASFVIYFWLMASFIAELHGFASRGLVAVGMLLTALATGFVLGLAMILLLGPEALMPNV